MLGDECFVGERRRHRRRASRSTRSRRSRPAPSSTPRSCGSRRGARSLFGRDGVAGLANVDITPELAARVAMAYATTLKKGATVITSRDSSRSARMLKRAMMAGLNAGGRQRARPRGGVGAGHPLPGPPARRPRAASPCAWSTGDPQSVRHPLLRRATASTSPRTPSARSSGCFYREDFRRVFPAEIGDIGFPPRALEHYTAALEATVDVGAHRAAPASRSSSTTPTARPSFVMPNVLAKLGADVLAVNPYASTAGAIWPSTGPSTPPASATWCAPRARTSAR